MEQRWETLEACEAAVQTKGRLRLATEHLQLLEVEEGELIRVSRAPRPEFVDWRYGPRLSSGGAKPGFWEKALARLPAAPLEGYDPYGGILGRTPDPGWFASPFLASASPLTYLFSQVPLAPKCPNCARPLALRPWSFQDLRFLSRGGRVEVLAQCGFCSENVPLSLSDARPALRLGLSIVVPPPLLRRAAEAGLEELDGRGGPQGFLDDLSRAASPLGHLETRTRAGLIIALDELAEGEALEAEWSTAEELAAISDGELTRVPGFREFRRRVLGTDR
jgi:hypothetical protein